MNKINRKIAMLGVLVVLTIFLVSFVNVIYHFSSAPISNSVIINEICSNNFNLIKDNNGQYSDYVELYNPSNETVLLDGCYLSDDENQLKKISLNTISIPPMGYYVVWLSRDTDISEDGSFEFGVSKYGETIFLSDAKNGVILDFVVVPPLPYNNCYGRIIDGGTEWAKMSDTVGRSNIDANILPTISQDAPIFSAESGFYDEPFEVTLTAAEGSTIYYTLDGSNPTCNSYIYQTPLTINDVSQNKNVYSSRTDLSTYIQYEPPFLVDKATILRAISYNSKDNTVSEIITKVYFIGYNDKLEYKNLPIISIVTDPDNLFDIQKGIYGNGVAMEQYKENGGLRSGELLSSYIDKEGEQHALYMASNAFNRGRGWEREAVITYFDALHEFCFEQNVGIRIAGEASRSRPQKSISIFGREIYGGTSKLSYEFFPDTSYSTIKLRNGGNNNGKVMIKDAFLEELAVGRNISIQGSTPCVLFLDGEYWGIYNIRERYKEEYLYNHYEVSEDNVWIINRGIAEVGENEAQDAYQLMIDVINESDLSYDDEYAMVCDMIDIQSLIDYCCINLYVGNKDVALERNTALWRTIETGGRAYHDGKWRWMLYDMDMSLIDDSDVSWMTREALMNEPIISSLMSNEKFRKQFCLTFMDIANTNYAYDMVYAKLTEWEDIYREQIVKTNQRFYDENFSEEIFHGYIKEMNDFFKNRFTFAMESLAYAFDLTGEIETITIKSCDSQGGTIIINTVQLDGIEKWSGQYFTDYPIVLSAAPKEGYRFAGWCGDVNSEESTVEIDLSNGEINVEAIFEKPD